MDKIGSPAWCFNTKQIPNEIEFVVKDDKLMGIYHFIGTHNSQYFNEKVECEVVLKEKCGKIQVKNNLNEIYHTAILYTPICKNGIRWSTLKDKDELLFYPPLVKYIIDGFEVTELFNSGWGYKLNNKGKELFNKFSEDDIYYGGLENIKIKWIPNGVPFKVINKSESEDVEIFNPKEWFKC